MLLRENEEGSSKKSWNNYHRNTVLTLKEGEREGKKFG